MVDNSQIDPSVISKMREIAASAKDCFVVYSLDEGLQKASLYLFLAEVDGSAAPGCAPAQLGAAAAAGTPALLTGGGSTITSPVVGVQS